MSFETHSSNRSRCHLTCVRSVESRSHRVDGVAAALSREDAIDATAYSLTRREGPDAVRNALNIENKTTLMEVRWPRVASTA